MIQDCVESSLGGSALIGCEGATATSAVCGPIEIGSEVSTVHAVFLSMR